MPSEVFSRKWADTPVRLYIWLLPMTFASIFSLQLRSSEFWRYSEGLQYGLYTLGIYFSSQYVWQYTLREKRGFKYFVLICVVLSSMMTFLFSTMYERPSGPLVFEISWAFSHFLVFPLLFWRRMKIRSKFFIVSVPVCLFFWLGEVPHPPLQQFFRGYAFVNFLFISVGVIQDNPKSSKIKHDPGYLLLLSLMTAGFAHYVGYQMLSVLSQTGTLVGRTQVMFVWVASCIGLRSLWYTVARRATTSILAPVFCLPFQLAVDLYDELVFGIVSWRQTRTFWLFLALRFVLNLVYNTGAYYDAFFYSSKIGGTCARRHLGMAAATQDRPHSPSARSRRRKRWKEEVLLLWVKRIFYEQNIFTEQVAALVVLSGILLEALLQYLGYSFDPVMTIKGQSTVDLLISHAIATAVVLASTHLAGLLLQESYNRSILAKMPETFHAFRSPHMSEIAIKTRQRSRNRFILPQHSTLNQAHPCLSPAGAEVTPRSTEQQTGQSKGLRRVYPTEAKDSAESAARRATSFSFPPRATAHGSTGPRAPLAALWSHSPPPPDSPLPGPPPYLDQSVGRGALRVGGELGAAERQFWAGYRRRRYLPPARSASSRSSSVGGEGGRASPALPGGEEGAGGAGGGPASARRAGGGGRAAAAAAAAAAAGFGPDGLGRPGRVWRRHWWFCAACMLGAVSGALRQWVSLLESMGGVHV